MITKDPYTALGVSRSASQEAIKGAYRRLVKSYHPDLNGNDPVVADKFREIQAAYEIVGDSDKRKKYDLGQFSRINIHNGKSTAARRQRSGLDDFMEIFLRRGNINKQAQSHRPPPNLDIWHSIMISLSLAVTGGKRTISLAGNRKLAITIPPGSRDGMRLRLKGQGLTKAEFTGDLFVVLQVIEDQKFRVTGADIHMEVPVTLAEAVRGGKITVATLSGKVAISLQSMTQSGQQLRLKGKGIPACRDHAGGDLYLHINVMIPDPMPAGLQEEINKLPLNGSQLRNKS